MGAKLSGRLRYLEGGKDGVGFADDAHDDGALLYGLLCVLNLEDTALGGAGRESVSLREVSICVFTSSYKVTESLS